MNITKRCLNMTKKELRKAFNEYCNTESVGGVWYKYKNPSRYKIEAYYGCVRICAKLRGRLPTILRHNSHGFSYCFVTDIYGGVTFVYITKDYLYKYNITLDTLTKEKRYIGDGE